MDWAAPSWPLILVVAGTGVVAGVTVGIVSWISGRRRKHTHLSLVQQALDAMTACLDEPPSAGVRVHRELVAALDELQSAAKRLDRDVRPRVEEPGVADVIRSTIRTFSGNDRQPSADAGPAAEIGPVPMADAAPNIDDLYAEMADTMAARVRQAAVVLAHARRLSIVLADVEQRLTDAIADAAGAERDSRMLADDGRFVAALCQLTCHDLPVPDNGVPAMGTRRELDRQAAWLAQITQDYRAEVLGWCDTALRRHGAVEGKERTAS